MCGRRLAVPDAGAVADLDALGDVRNRNLPQNWMLLISFFEASTSKACLSSSVTTSS